MYLEVEFSDGFILNQLKQNDVSMFDNRRNTFYDIVNKLCEKDHGKMKRLSLFKDNREYSIDWTRVPSNATPICLKTFSMDINGTDAHVKKLVNVEFGYEYDDVKTKKIIRSVEVIS
jgi:hypothetical protein